MSGDWRVDSAPNTSRQLDSNRHKWVPGMSVARIADIPKTVAMEDFILALLN